MKKRKPRPIDPIVANPLITGVGGILPAMIEEPVWVAGAVVYIKRVGAQKFLRVLLEQLRDSLVVHQEQANLILAVEKYLESTDVAVSSLAKKEIGEPDVWSDIADTPVASLLKAHTRFAEAFVALKNAQNNHLEKLRDAALPEDEEPHEKTEARYAALEEALRPKE